MRSRNLLLIFFTAFTPLHLAAQNDQPRLFIPINLVQNSDPKIVELLGQQFELVVTNDYKEPIVQDFITEQDSLIVMIKSANQVTPQKFFYSSSDTIYPKLWIGAGTLFTLILLYFYRF